MWHSPLVRARETAALLADAAKSRAALLETSGLRPEDDPEEVVARLERVSRPSLVLVGHEPYMSALASRLVTGAAQPPRFAFQKCALLALEGAGRHWAVQWFLTPDVVGERDA